MIVAGVPAKVGESTPLWFSSTRKEKRSAGNSCNDIVVFYANHKSNALLGTLLVVLLFKNC